MLIYNHQQEFVGINEKDLKSLGFRNLADLQSECKDFADLFVKRPTYRATCKSQLEILLKSA